MNSPPLKLPKKKEIHTADQLFYLLLKLSGISLLILLLLILGYLLIHAWPTIHLFGWRFLTSSVWDPVKGIFGAAPVLYGTLVSSAIAVCIATPLSVGVAIYLTELAPVWLGKWLGFLVEMLAAIPSIVYGLWGIFFLAPWLRDTAQPFLEEYLGFLPFFQGPSYGIGMLAAGLILAIMITPTIFSITREIFLSIPKAQKESALALGATRWESIYVSVLKASQSGIQGAVILGLGRAIGETMAVTMVIGNRAQISFSLFAPAQTMSSVIANEYTEASSDLHLSALVEVGLVLFVMTFLMNSIARIFILKPQSENGSKRKRGQPA